MNAWKGENSNFAAQKCGRYHLHQVIEINNTMGNRGNIMFLTICDEKDTSFLLASSFKPITLVFRKHQTNQN